jgi:hypothetical protein
MVNDFDNLAASGFQLHATDLFEENQSGGFLKHPNCGPAGRRLR